VRSHLKSKSRFQGVRHTNIAERPAAVLGQFQIVRTILQPYPKIVVWFVKQFVRIVPSTLCDIWGFFPLKTRVTPDA
jgi:hypothetical protein